MYATEIDTERNAAATLLDHLTQGHADDGVTLRELTRKAWKGLDRPQLEAAVRYLETRGWLRVERTTPGEAGGRPSTRLRLHPDLAEHWEATA